MGDAVILAGGRSPRELMKHAPYKACLTAGGQPMVLRVVHALLGAPSIDRVYVLGNTEALSRLPFPDSVTLAEGADNISEVLCRAAKLTRRDRPLLLAAADIPLLTPSTVEHFLQNANSKHADLAYPIVRQEHMTAYAPHAHRTYVHLADGTFTGGNLIYVGQGISEDLLAFADRIFRARKHPWRLASIFGWNFCLSFLLGRLTVSGIEQRLTDIWGRRCRALIMPHPELALDVDKLSDYHAIQTHIRQTTR